MDGEQDRENVRCELWPGLSPATEPLEPLETPEAPAPGVLKDVRIEGEEGKEFLCFPGAHPGQDHVFRVGGRRVTVPRDKFQLQGRKFFRKVEVTWE